LILKETKGEQKMNFSEFKKIFQNNFAEMTKDADYLYEIEIDKDEFWNLYLDSYPAGTNEIYRQRREFDCSCCRHFIKSIGNAVVIKNNKVRTMWDFRTGDTTFQPVIDALNAYLLTKSVTNLYVSKFAHIGTARNFENLGNGNVTEWEHFSLDLPRKFVDTTYRSVGDIQGQFRDTRNVFKRSLDEISEDAVMTVLELIASDSLYKGAEWKSVLEKFLEYKRLYDRTPDNEKDNFAWENSSKAGVVIGRIRNHSIGTLLVDISEDVDLDTAVKKYEVIVAPTNYKRPKAIFTKKMLEDAKKTIEELGYMNSLARRYATLDDITVNNILFSNKDAAKRISGVSVFDEMMSEATSSSKKFSKVEEVSVDKFVSDILPTASGLEAYLENRHASNMVSLIAPKNDDAKTMFKWDNGFSWAYSGNLTDSDVKQNVKSAGGAVDGVLRFSIQWNDEDYNNNDFDAHCVEPNGHEIYYGDKVNRYTGGNLDVDIIDPMRGRPAVENITWPIKSKMGVGKYRFYVNCYNNRGGRSGFKAEIEFDGQIYSFNYNKTLRHKENVQVAEVTLDANGNFTIKELLPSNVSSRDVWGVKTNQFIPVSVVMYSPNYWDEQQGIGNKHYFFMLKDCINPEKPNGFYNEFLKQELVQHKRVFEALGGKMKVESVEDQLSGLGFSSTLRNDLVVKVKGQTERIMRIKF
jgi:hypothetical protein